MNNEDEFRMDDSIFKNRKFLESISRTIEDQKRLLEPFQLAIKQLGNSGIGRYENLITAPFEYQVAGVGSAIFSGIYQFDNSLVQAFQTFDIPWCQTFDNMVSVGAMMGTQFQELVKPIYYLPEKNGLVDGLQTYVSAVEKLTLGLDTSWIQTASQWQTQLSKLSSVDLSPLVGMETSFAKLVKVEKETSGLSLMADYPSITSVAAQIASIQQSLLGISINWQGIIAPAQLLSDYAEFALQQHRQIQKAASLCDEKTLAWRLDLLEAASKFVDRQISWSNGLAVDLQEEVGVEIILPHDTGLSIEAIPSYLGYSKRDDKSVDDALTESMLTIITEKGKLIVQKADIINSLCKLNNTEVLFEDTESYAGYYYVLGRTFCRNTDTLEDIVQALYSMFFLQRKTIAKFVGYEKCECLCDIDELKNDKKHFERPKDITKIQNRLYDQILTLEDALICALKSGSISTGQSHVDNEFRVVIQEDKCTEKKINENIFKALFNLQNNKVFNGREENEWNDGVRDFLKMIYEVKDQTRQGISSTGHNAGEIDLQICRDGLPVAMIEGLKIDAVNREYIKSHIDKVLTNYDPCGCPLVYIIIYATVKKFSAFWSNLMSYIKGDYVFPYAVAEEFCEINHMFTESRHGKVVLLRNDQKVSIHFYAVAMQE